MKSLYLTLHCAGLFSFPEKGPLKVIASVCHSRESGNPCLSASLMDSRFRGNDRKLNSPVALRFFLELAVGIC